MIIVIPAYLWPPRGRIEWDSHTHMPFWAPDDGYMEEVMRRSVVISNVDCGEEAGKE